MIPSEHPVYPVSIYSHAGQGGKNNEDRYAVEHYTLNEKQARPSLLAMVADGIGASRAGQVAAQLAVDAVTRLVAQSDASQPSGILQAAIIQASQVILQRSQTRREWNGMGSTCLCAWLVGERLYSASVGNARLYLLRGQNLQQLNVVHQLPGDVGRQPAAAARGKRSRDEDPLRGYLGAKTPVDAELRMYSASGGRPALRHQGLRLQPNDRLLLCTGGLGDGLQPAEIADILAISPTEEAAETLVNYGLKQGLQNNLTGIVIAMPPALPPLAAQQSLYKRGLLKAAALALLVLLALLAWQRQPDTADLLGQPSATAIQTLTPLPTHTSNP